MTMKNPAHPGLSVRHDCIEPLDLTITKAADILGVTRQALNNLVNAKSGISPEMAIRLDKALTRCIRRRTTMRPLSSNPTTLQLFLRGRSQEIDRSLHRASMLEGANLAYLDLMPVKSNLASIAPRP